MCVCNSAVQVIHSRDLNGDGVAAVDIDASGGRCCTCTIGFDILSALDHFTVSISCFYKKQACLKLEPLELARAA